LLPTALIYSIEENDGLNVVFDYVGGLIEADEL
jgi:hypothetical protein